MKINHLKNEERASNTPNQSGSLPEWRQKTAYDADLITKCSEGARLHIMLQELMATNNGKEDAKNGARTKVIKLEDGYFLICIGCDIPQLYRKIA